MNNYRDIIIRPIITEKSMMATVNNTYTFEVKKDNGSKKLTIYNEAKKATVVEISKQDKDTKKELAGATLVIKNSA